MSSLPAFPTGNACDVFPVTSDASLQRTESAIIWRTFIYFSLIKSNKRNDKSIKKVFQWKKTILYLFFTCWALYLKMFGHRAFHLSQKLWSSGTFYFPHAGIVNNWRIYIVFEHAVYCYHTDNKILRVKRIIELQ